MTAKNLSKVKDRQSENNNPTWFDKLSPLKKDVACVIALLVIIYILFFKIITSNMIFSDSGDTAAAQSWGKAVEMIRTAENVDALWIPYIFSGMPIAGALIFPLEVNYLEKIIQLPGRLLFLNADLAWFVLHYFLMGLFMYMLARKLKFSHLPSTLAALTLMLNPYAIGLAQEGHGSKLVTLSYIPLVFLLAIMLFEKRSILNFGLMAAVTGTMLLSRHPQIAFYGLMLVGCYIFYEVILDIKREPGRIVTNSLLLVLALALGFAIYTYEYLPTQQYTPYSIRGGGGASASAGLSYDYATNWSFHPLEALTYIIPSFFGFSSGYVSDWQGREMALPLYWGWMPFTDGPVYAGIIPVLLLIFALVYRRSKMTWFLSIFSILVFLIAFGKYFGVVYNLLFNYLPYFNKFRAPSMVLYLIPLTFGLLAATGMTFLMELPEMTREFDTAGFKKRLTRTLMVFGGLIIIAFLAKSLIYGFLSGFMFNKEGEVQQYGQQVVNIFREKRFEIFWGDSLKSLILSGAAIGMVVLFITRKVSRTIMGAVFILLVAADLLIIDFRFIDPKPKTAMDEKFLQDATVNFLKTDNSQFRIFPLGQDLFQDNTFMYHAVSSIGGYSPAKLQIYQEMIESCLYHGADPQFPINMNVVNMLNAKYLVAQGRLPEGKGSVVNVDQARGMVTYLNPGFFPRGWFVDTALVLSSKTEIFREMNSSSWNPRSVAILEKRPLVAFSKPDSASASVVIIESRSLKLSVFTSKAALLVLSEVYYPAGWKAYVDGAETEIYKTDYILRSVVVPQGEHNVDELIKMFHT